MGGERRPGRAPLRGISRTVQARARSIAAFRNASKPGSSKGDEQAHRPLLDVYVTGKSAFDNRLALSPSSLLRDRCVPYTARKSGLRHVNTATATPLSELAAKACRLRATSGMISTQPLPQMSTTSS